MGMHFLLVKGAKQFNLQRWWGNKKGSGTEGTYGIKFLIATQTITPHLDIFTM